METYVRGASYEAIVEYNKKLNQAMAGSAAAIGATVLLEDRPGYFPLNNDKNLNALAKEAMEAIGGPGCVEVTDHWDTGSTDMGDVSSIMPAVHPTAQEPLEPVTAWLYTTNPERACVAPAKCLADHGRPPSFQ